LKVASLKIKIWQKKLQWCHISICVNSILPYFDFAVIIQFPQIYFLQLLFFTLVIPSTKFDNTINLEPGENPLEITVKINFRDLPHYCITEWNFNKPNEWNELVIRTAARFYSQKVRIQKVVIRSWTNDSERHFQEMKCGFCCKKGERENKSQKKVPEKKVVRLFLSFSSTKPSLENWSKNLKF
jgi:hypothetical protein